MAIKKLRVYIPVDVEISEDHLEMVMSKEWQDDFYHFDNANEFALYAARLMLVVGSTELGRTLKTGSLRDWDGHCTDNLEDNGRVVIAPEDDDGWNIETMRDFAGDI
jgi:hypothetical protein